MNTFGSVLTVIAMATASLSAAAIAGEASADLSLTFSGIEEKQGAVLGVLFDSEAAYDGKGAPVRQLMIPADAAELATKLEGLPPGTYAIKAFHDVDGDHKMGSNPYGMPTEPFVFSNNAQGAMGPAKWADAKFEVKAGANAHSLAFR